MRLQNSYSENEDLRGLSRLGGLIGAYFVKLKFARMAAKNLIEGLKAEHFPRFTNPQARK